MKTAIAKAPNIKSEKKQDRKLLRREFRLNMDCYLYIAPWAVIFLVFTVAPVVMALGLGFTYFNMLELPRFIGLDNFKNLLASDDLFIVAVKNTLSFAIIIGPMGYLMSLMFAWFINELSPVTRAIMVTIMYAPSISGSGLMIWQMLFSGDQYGYLNGTMLNLGIINQPIQFVQTREYMFPIAIIVSLWMGMGVGFLSYVAGFKTVNKEQYEAAYVEGIRNRWQELWFITLPSIRPQMMFNAVLSVGGAFTVGGVMDQLFGFPSPGYATHTIMNHIQDFGVTRFDMGYACAIATLLFLTMIGTNELFQRILQKVGQ